jgi:hypothetical protein
MLHQEMIRTVLWVEAAMIAGLVSAILLRPFAEAAWGLGKMLTVYWVQ